MPIPNPMTSSLLTHTKNPCKWFNMQQIFEALATMIWIQLSYLMSTNWLTRHKGATKSPQSGFLKSREIREEKLLTTSPGGSWRFIFRCMDLIFYLTHAPVSRLSTLSLLLTLAVKIRLKVNQRDFSTMFLNALLDDGWCGIYTSATSIRALIENGKFTHVTKGALWINSGL